MRYSIVCMILIVYILVVLSILCVIGICESERVESENDRILKMKNITRELNDIELTKISFGVEIKVKYAACIVSYDKVGIIQKNKVEFLKFVYSYKGAYDITSQTYTFSGFVLDEEKSSFYLDGSTKYCSLEEKEYSYSELKQCNDAIQYIESKKLPIPSKLVISDESELYFEGDEKPVDEFKSSIYYHYYYYYSK